MRRRIITPTPKPKLALVVLASGCSRQQGGEAADDD